MAAQQSNTRWWHGVLNVQTVIALGTAVVAIVAFVLKVNADNADIKELKKEIATKATIESVRDLDDKVTRQYSVQKAQNDKEALEIEEALDWQHEWDGYWKRVTEEKNDNNGGNKK